MSLPGVITQKTSAAAPPGASGLDYDDCAVYATLWAARASRPDLPAPTLTAFRAAAGNVDDPWTDGLYDREVWAGVVALYPTAGATHYVGPDYDGFVELLQAGWIASLAVVSAELPYNLRFGFYGRHRIGVAYVNGGFVVANPLAAQGSAPLPCSGTALRAATLAIGGVFAVLFPPPIQETDMLVVAEAVRFDAPRTFRIAAGSTINGYDPARPGAPVLSRGFSSASSAQADATVTVRYPGTTKAPVPKGGPFLRVVDGVFAGLLVVAAYVALDPAPPPPAPDCTAAVKAATDPLNAKIAAARKALG